MSDESAADDGAIYRFWAFIERRREQGKPEFDLADVAKLRAAIAEFERS
jgi:hypothetical protein